LLTVLLGRQPVILSEAMNLHLLVIEERLQILRFAQNDGRVEMT